MIRPTVMYQNEPYAIGKPNIAKRSQEYGVGLVGLIPQYKGNQTPRYSDEDLEFIVMVIEEHYETFKQKNARAFLSNTKGKMARIWTHFSRAKPYLFL